jgi:hypothetical protein
MPFAKELEDLWQLGIQETILKLGCVCIRADKIDLPGFVVSQIYNQILEADVVIAEMTGQNPNVFYEVGWAHALGKPTILCATNSDELRVFDTQAYRHILHDGRAYVLRKELNRIVPGILKCTLTVPSSADIVWAWPSNEYEPPVFEWKADPKRTGGQVQKDIFGGQSIELTETGEKLVRVRDSVMCWNHIPEWSITQLIHRSRSFQIGDEAILSVVVRTDAESDIEFCGDGAKAGPEGTRVWALGFPSVRKRISSPLWCHLLLSSVIGPTKDGQDPTASGISAFIRYHTNGQVWLRQVSLYRRGTQEIDKRDRPKDNPGR